MTQYLVAIHHPDGYDGSSEDEAMHRDIDRLNAVQHRRLEAAAGHAGRVEVAESAGTAG